MTYKKKMRLKEKLIEEDKNKWITKKKKQIYEAKSIKKFFF